MCKDCDSLKDLVKNHYSDYFISDIIKEIFDIYKNEIFDHIKSKRYLYEEFIDDYIDSDDFLKIKGETNIIKNLDVCDIIADCDRQELILNLDIDEIKKILDLYSEDEILLLKI